MIQLSSTGEAEAPPPARLDRETLETQTTHRRVRLAELESEMIAACEAAAGGSCAPPDTAFGHERRDRKSWRRYLAAAMRLEATYGPQMRRLRREIGQLERLMTLLIEE